MNVSSLHSPAVFSGSVARFCWPLVVLLALFFLPGCKGEEDKSAEAPPAAPKVWDTTGMRPDFLAKFEQYQPEIPQVREEHWMTPEIAEQFHYGGGPGMHMYRTYFRESLQGNPYAMVMMRILSNNAWPQQQKAQFTAIPDVPEKVYTREFWDDWADRFMGPGWAYARLGDLENGSSWYGSSAARGSAEGAYLSSGANYSELIRSAEMGWPDAMGDAARIKFVYGRDKKHPINAISLEQATEWGFRSAFSCSKEGLNTASVMYEHGFGGVEKDLLISETFKWCHWSVEEPHWLPIGEKQITPENLELVRRQGTMLLERCEQARQARLAEERIRWKRLTEELNAELAPMTKLLRP